MKWQWLSWIVWLVVLDALLVLAALGFTVFFYGGRKALSREGIRKTWRELTRPHSPMPSGKASKSKKAA